VSNRSSSRRLSSACWASKAFLWRSARTSCALSYQKLSYRCINSTTNYTHNHSDNYVVTVTLGKGFLEQRQKRNKSLAN